MKDQNKEKEKKNKSLVSMTMNPDIWLEFKILCLKKKRNMGEYAEELIVNELNKQKATKDKDDEIKLF